MALRARLTAKVGRVYDKVRNKLETGLTCTLVKPHDTNDAFTTVLAITSKWFFEYSNFRRNFLLEIADDSGSLTTAMASATHVKVNNDYYVILTDDTTPPLGTDPTWKIYVDTPDRPEHFTTL